MAGGSGRKVLATSSTKTALNNKGKRLDLTAAENLNANDTIPQASQSSSDDGVVATIAQQMQLTAEKKKKDKEYKFLQLIQAELSKCLSEKAHEFIEDAAEMEKHHAKYQEEYTALNAHIVSLWKSIQEEQEKLQTLYEEQSSAISERERQRDHEHTQALTHGRKACEESGRLINSIDPSVKLPSFLT